MMEGYLPTALKNLVQAEFFHGKNSLNFDSGRICSTVLTLEGFLRDLGVMASTRLLCKVHGDEKTKREFNIVMSGHVCATCLGCIDVFFMTGSHKKLPTEVTMGQCYKWPVFS